MVEADRDRLTAEYQTLSIYGPQSICTNFHGGSNHGNNELPTSVLFKRRASDADFVDNCASRTQQDSLVMSTRVTRGTSSSALVTSPWVLELAAFCPADSVQTDRSQTRWHRDAGGENLHTCAQEGRGEQDQGQAGRKHLRLRHWHTGGMACQNVRTL
ncbi:hypothetical protein AAHC03_05424 [Spirometra sp. Aus1]